MAGDKLKKAARLYKKSEGLIERARTKPAKSGYKLAERSLNKKTKARILDGTIKKTVGMGRVSHGTIKMKSKKK